MKSKTLSTIHQPRLYEMVADRISKDYVVNATSGDRLPTESEFANVYGVSVPTVREALRSLAQAGLLHRRQGSGTYRMDPSQVSASVALITPLDLCDARLSCHFTQIALQTAKSLKKLGLTSQIYFGETAAGTARTFDDCLLREDIEAGKIAAAVLISESSDPLAYVDLLKHRNIPVLRSDSTVTASGKPRIQSFLELAVDSLVRHGRRKIACIGFGANSHSDSAPTFAEIVAQRGGITDSAWVIGDLHPSTSGSGYSLMREIWTTGKLKPDALVLCDDIFLEDTTLAMRELGIQSPDKLMIVSYSNKGECLKAPFPLIELRYDAISVAEQLASNVAAVLQGLTARELISEPELLDPFEEEFDLGESRDERDQAPPPSHKDLNALGIKSNKGEN